MSLNEMKRNIIKKTNKHDKHPDFDYPFFSKVFSHQSSNKDQTFANCRTDSLSFLSDASMHKKKLCRTERCLCQARSPNTEQLFHSVFFLISNK